MCVYICLHTSKLQRLTLSKITFKLSGDNMISGEKKKNNSPIAGQLSLTYAGQRAINSLLLLLLLSPAIPSVRAQPGPNESGSDTYPYARFSPSMAIIIAVLVTALFFMGIFSIYIRRCSDTAGGSIRPILSLRSRRAAAARGLDAEVIETFPTLAYSAVKGLKIGKGALECAVCLNEFEDDETLRLIPKCDHVFHPECIDAWLASHVTCPVCRADLVPQPGESLHLPAELNSVNPDSESHNNQETDHDNQQNGDVSIHVERPPVEMMDRNRSLKQNLPPRSRSVRAAPRLFERFRSHSTGHSLVQPGENVDRFTLRLPEDVRKQVLKRAYLNRTASNVVVLPREGSSRRGFRTGEGSSRGRSYRRLESLDRPVKSDRWGFSRMPSFLTRALSVRSPKFGLAKAEPSTSEAQPRGDDSGRPPV